MAKTLTFVLALLVSLTGISQPKETEVKSTIEHVTVFLRGAQVKRTASKNINSGTSYLKFTDLSPVLDPNSIQVKATGDVTILSVQHQQNYLITDTKPIRIRVLEDSLESLQQIISRNTNMQQVYNEEKALILANKSVKGEQTGLDVEELEYTADFFRERLEELFERQMELQLQQKKNNETLTKVQSQLNELNAKWRKSTSEIIVELSANVRTSSKFELSYLVRNASWTPLYDLRAANASGPVLLNYKANVYQNSGVDWEKVDLTLSTGNPTLSGNKPNLKPWVLSYSSNRYGVSKSQGYYEQSNFALPVEEITNQEYDEREKSVFDGAGSTTTANFTTLANNQTNASFEIKVPYNIPSDGKYHLVNIQNVELNADYSYFAAPKVDSDAFLLAKVTKWEEYNLLSGTANLYFQDTYVGKSYINTATTSDTLDLSFGRDKSVIIERKKIKDFTKQKTLGSDVKQNVGIEITIRNAKNVPIQIELKDQIPISSVKDIEVKLEEDGEGSLNETTGALIWNLNLEPAAAKTILFKYTITWPKSKAKQLQLVRAKF